MEKEFHQLTGLKNDGYALSQRMLDKVLTRIKSTFEGSAPELEWIFDGSSKEVQGIEK